VAGPTHRTGLTEKARKYLKYLRAFSVLTHSLWAAHTAILNEEEFRAVAPRYGVA
jgi:hypothetical protein